MRRRYVILSIFTALATAVIIPLLYFNVRRGPAEVHIDKTVFPVTGIDISAHNGNVDFEQLVNDSIDFVMLKATEGTTFKDPKFHYNYLQARSAGVKAIGAYHFFRFDTDGEMQAINLLHSLRGKSIDMPVAIDLEEWTNPSNISTHEVIGRLENMISLLEQNGYTVMFYTNKDGYQRFLRNRFKDYPIWICSFTDPPLDANESEWTLWQYSHLGNTPACASPVDLNTFNGSREEWQAWLKTSIF